MPDLQQQTMRDALQTSDSELRQLESRIRTINDMAQIKRATKANVSTDWVLGVGGFDLKRYEEEVSHSKVLSALWSLSAPFASLQAPRQVCPPESGA